MHILVPFIEISLILICDKIANRATSIVSFTNSRSSIVSRHPEAFSLKLGISHHFLSQSLKSFVPQFLSPSITSIISKWKSIFFIYGAKILTSNARTSISTSFNTFEIQLVWRLKFLIFLVLWFNFHLTTCINSIPLSFFDRLNYRIEWIDVFNSFFA